MLVGVIWILIVTGMNWHSQKQESHCKGISYSFVNLKVRENNEFK